MSRTGFELTTSRWLNAFVKSVGPIGHMVLLVNIVARLVFKVIVLDGWRGERAGA
jgi:hypothetical protein